MHSTVFKWLDHSWSGHVNVNHFHSKFSTSNGSNGANFPRGAAAPHPTLNEDPRQRLHIVALPSHSTCDGSCHHGSCGRPHRIEYVPSARHRTVACPYVGDHPITDPCGHTSSREAPICHRISSHRNSSLLGARHVPYTPRPDALTYSTRRLR